MNFCVSRLRGFSKSQIRVHHYDSIKTLSRIVTRLLTSDLCFLNSCFEVLPTAISQKWGKLFSTPVPILAVASCLAYYSDQVWRTGRGFVIMASDTSIRAFNNSVRAFFTSS